MLVADADMVDGEQRQLAPIRRKLRTCGIRIKTHIRPQSDGLRGFLSSKRTFSCVECTYVAQAYLTGRAVAAAGERCIQVFTARCPIWGIYLPPSSGAFGATRTTTTTSSAAATSTTSATTSRNLQDRSQDSTLVSLRELPRATIYMLTVARREETRLQESSQKPECALVYDTLPLRSVRVLRRLVASEPEFTVPQHSGPPPTCTICNWRALS